MYDVMFELINGIKIGIEHVSFDEEDEPEWLIALDILVFRFGIVKY